MINQSYFSHIIIYVAIVEYLYLRKFESHYCRLKINGNKYKFFQLEKFIYDFRLIGYVLKTATYYDFISTARVNTYSSYFSPCRSNCVQYNTPNAPLFAKIGEDFLNQGIAYVEPIIKVYV